MIRAAILALATITSLQGQPCPTERDYPWEKPDNSRVNGLDVAPFFDMCKRVPKAVACAGSKGTRELSLNEVTEIDWQYRSVFQYRDDRTTHGKDDYYSNWTACGDCEDYALTLSEMLAAHGQKDMALQLMLLCDQDGCDGHATLWVTTSDYGIVEVDNNAGPRPINTGKCCVREGFIAMDGRKKLTPMYDFKVDGMGFSPRDKSKAKP